MEKYIGVKLISAEPMTLNEYERYVGKGMVNVKDQDGYLVEYEPREGEESNHPDHKGYISWSPKEVFEEAYRPTDGLSYGLAVEALKKGLKVARSGWNGKGMFVFKQVPSKIDPEVVPKMTSLPQSVKDALIARGQGPHYQNQMAIVKPDGSVDSWVASSSDTFADDWMILF